MSGVGDGLEMVGVGRRSRRWGVGGGGAGGFGVGDGAAWESASRGCGGFGVGFASTAGLAEDRDSKAQGGDDGKDPGHRQIVPSLRHGVNRC